jgi:hypothetical protein
MMNIINKDHSKVVRVSKNLAYKMKMKMKQNKMKICYKKEMGRKSKLEISKMMMTRLNKMIYLKFKWKKRHSIISNSSSNNNKENRKKSHI